jgi:hypothetical protein
MAAQMRLFRVRSTDSDHWLRKNRRRCVRLILMTWSCRARSSTGPVD